MNTRNHTFNQTVVKDGVVSVAELFSDVIKKRHIDLPDESYQVPKIFLPKKKPVFVYNQEKKLNYISLFEEKTDPSLNMIKIHVKKKHEVPGPQAYAK